MYGQRGVATGHTMHCIALGDTLLLIVATGEGTYMAIPSYSILYVNCDLSRRDTVPSCCVCGWHAAMASIQQEQ